MSKDIEQKRIAIAEAYPGERWFKKVKEMPDYQVVAIYNHFLRDGVFAKSRFMKASKGRKEEPKQMSLEDFGIDLGTSYRRRYA